ncbi:AfsR/SARP family transcriptional regulator [Nonomuraea turcica]|uniref:AfsR/SARP family transcriptional regulator n=1 Tax=Nonomuraea sp. G32 TaxID=3067274 RepID=UPI00273C496E|nr:AfsR/SARP family transcriptional regulator [Nonomuraea sp. G32]MDP4502682.1 AfsR/SARP family transcriptional regulator [Nonomuraea sp. G32]
MDHLEFRLLGSIDACVGGRRLEIGPRKRRFVLAALLLDLNRPVPVERLIDAVWEGGPPDSARMTVQGHVYRLRKSGVRVESDPAGYVLCADPDHVDALRFRRLAARAAQEPGEPGADLLETALALWRGPALGGPGGGMPLEVAGVELEEARLAAVEELARRRLTLGQPERAVAPLRAMVTAEPRQERLVSLLMTAFYRLGRQAEALELYERTRRLLADQLGVDPGAELQATFEALLSGHTT